MREDGFADEGDYDRRRDEVWNGMSSEEKEEYLSTTKDQGNKRLDFRFAHVSFFFPFCVKMLPMLCCY